MHSRYRVLFEDGCEVECTQDFIGVRGAPSGEFGVSDEREAWKLTAPGWGADSNYGSGPLYVAKNTHPRLLQDYGVAYVAFCGCGCGGLVMAVADEKAFARDVATDVADCIKAGLVVSRMNGLRVRATPFGCQATKAQMTLDIEGIDS